MSDDDSMNEVPDNPEELSQMFQSIIKGATEAATESLLEDAWSGFKQMFDCMREAGFSRRDAIDVMAGYLYKIMSDGGTE